MDPLPFLRFLKRHRRLVLLFFCLFLLFLYYYTNLFIDWSDIKNWKFKKRTLPGHLYNLPKYEKYPGFDCSEFFNEEKNGLKGDVFEKYRHWGRIVLDENVLLPMNCESIKARVLVNLTYPTVDHSYATSRVIYKDYFWQETVLSQTYSPQNYYCYSIDAKSSQTFVNSMKALEKCLPNVIVSTNRFNFDSNGHFINYGHFDCSEQLIKKKGWEYILWAQNHDLILRTNQEMSRIIAYLNGSHAIGHKPAQWKRYAITNDWSATGLNLWKDPEKWSRRQREAVLDLSQNYNEVFISRELLEFVINEMNYKNLLGAFEVPYRFATDELFWATLIATEELGLPGAPIAPCVDNSHYITRYNEWEKWYNQPCKSTFSRHGTCIFGMEYLPLFAQLHHICANKILPDFDYGFIKCYGELLHERAFLRGASPASMAIYTGDARNNC